MHCTNLKQRNYRKRLVLLVLLALAFNALCSYRVFAAKCGGVDTALIECDEGGNGAIWHILRLILDILTIGVGVLGVIGIIWVGVRFLTAGSNEEKARIAKRRISEVVIGIACYVVLQGVLRWLLPGGNLDVDQDNTGITSVKISYSGTPTVGKTFVPKVSFNKEAVNGTYSLSSSDDKVVRVLGRNALCVNTGSAVIESIAANGLKSSMNVTCRPAVSKSDQKSSSGGTARSGNKNTDPDPTCDTSMIDKERGLTYEQAVKLAKYIGADKGNVGYKTVGSVWNRCGGGGSNCAAVGAFFYNKFTHHTIKTYDHGYRTLDHIRKRNKSLQVGTTPKVWSLAIWFIAPRTYGHTAVVVGRKKDGTWIVVEGSCQRGNMGKRGEGDGTYNGSGSAVVQTSKSIGSAIWEHSDNTWTKYGYIADEIDYCELAKYLKTGQ